MLSELPKLFGRSFAVGFLLPAAILGFAIFGILYVFRMSNAILAVIDKKDLFGATIALILVWFGAITFMALNRLIIRFMEGYGDANPYWLRFNSIQFAYDDLTETISYCEKRIKEAEDAGRVPDEQLMRNYSRHLRRMAQEYPDNRAWLLPTKFGNAMRAFEVYPRVIYGIESIEGWSRLISVIPADFRQLLEDAKAEMDFWVNIWLGAIVTVLLYVALAIVNKAVVSCWIPATSIAVALLSVRWARSAAQQWGMLVMSAFDLFRGELCRKLGLRLPRSVQHEREMWQVVNEVFIFRHGGAGEELTHYRIHQPDNQ